MPKKPQFNQEKRNLGWAFNNEIVLLMKELELLEASREKVKRIIQANQDRAEALGGIQKYISDNSSSKKPH